MAKPNRNQHWVPQFYLRHFATADTFGTARPQIWAFPIKEGEEFKTQPRNVAAKRDLYGYCSPEVDGRLTDLESMLGQFWPTITEKTYPVDLGFKQGISLFVATLYLRHPAELDRQRRRFAMMAHAVENGPKDADGCTTLSYIVINGKRYDVDPKEMNKWRTSTDGDVQESWGDHILDMTGHIARQLIERPWTVLVSDDPVFVTSDHPVTLFHATKEHAAILDPRTVIYLALTPRKLLLINQEDGRDGRIIGLRKLGDETPFNYSIFRGAYKHVFTPWDPIHLLQQVVDFDDFLRREEAKVIRRPQQASASRKIGRNEPCPCDSGRKYKLCCGRNA